MSGTAGNIMVGPVALYIGTAGEEPTTSLGYSSDAGADLSPGTSLLDVKVGERLGVVKQFVSEHAAKISCTLYEATLENFSKILHGSTLAGGVLTVDPTDSEPLQCSVKAVGLAPDGTVRTWKMLYASPLVTGAIPHAIRKVVEVPVEFTALAAGSALYSVADGAGDEAVTLSTGAFAYASGQNYYSVSGESAAADAMTDISGTIPDLTVAIIQIASVDEPITVTHGSGTLELDGDADWIMTSVNDTLWLKYDLGNTKWVELQRFNARA